MAGVPEPVARATARARCTASSAAQVGQCAGTRARSRAPQPRTTLRPGARTVRTVSGHEGGNSAASAPANAPPILPARRAENPRAPLLRRLGALLYEALLLLAMALIVVFAFLPLTSSVREGDRTALTIPPVFVRTMLFCVLAAAAAVYYTWCWSEARRTLPQKTWQLRIVDNDGTALTRKTALLRYAAAWIGPAAALAVYAILHATSVRGYALILLVLNYAWALIDRDRQFLHDRIAGTRVVRDR